MKSESEEQIMDDIEIAIKISEKEYNAIKEDKYGVFSGHIFEMIRNGRPLSEYYSVPKWIPTKERIPAPGKNILVCDSDGDIYVSYMCTDHTFGFDTSGNKIKNVVAWMNAPEPYKESGDK